MTHAVKHYTIEGAYHTDGCPTKFTGKSGTGRFTSKNPGSSAKKAFSSLCQRKKIHGKCSLIVKVRETTQGSKHKEFAYVAHRQLKAVPSPFGHKYEVKLKKISMDALEKKTCKVSKKSSGRMKSSSSKLLKKRKFTAPK